MARLAQSVERKALNLVVVGSSPTVGVFGFCVKSGHVHIAVLPPVPNPPRRARRTGRPIGGARIAIPGQAGLVWEAAAS